MSFSRYFKLVAIATALMIGYSPAAKKISSGKIRNASGPQALHEPKGKGGYIPAETGSKVTKKDRFKTGDESLIIIGLPDGSSLTINERTEAEMAELLNEDGINHNQVNILNGKVNFDVQKQAKGSDFKFKTGTATAAIRGTAGTIGFTSLMKPIASLRNGSLDIHDSSLNTKYNVKGGQTAFSIGKETVVLDLKSSGDAKFLDEIDKYISDPALENSKDEVIKLVQNADSSYQVRKEQLKQQANCEITPLPDTVYTAKQKVKVQCSKGTMVGIHDKPVISNGDIVELDAEWASSLIGAKKIALQCYVDSISYFPCGELTTYYAGAGDKESGDLANMHKPLTITTSSPAKVCDPASVTVEGTFDTSGTNATLYVIHGNKKSEDLIPYSANGKFSYTIQISDEKGNWNEDRVTVEYNSTEFETETAVLDLDIDKTCKGVNRIRPTIELQNYDSLSCNIFFTLDNLDQDYNYFTISTDNISGIESVVTKKITASRELEKGRHNYVFKVADLAGNSSQVSKTLGCYKTISGAYIRIDGKETERLRVPPPPRNYSNKFHKELRFTVMRLPGSVPVYIKSVKVTQNGKHLKTWNENEVSDIDFSLPVELTRGEDAEFVITVKLKSDQDELTAKKIYQVR